MPKVLSKFRLAFMAFLVIAGVYAWWITAGQAGLLVIAFSAMGVACFAIATTLIFSDRMDKVEQAESDFINGKGTK